MSKSQKIAAWVMTVLAGAAFYCFFAFQYPYHLHFQEQYQLFESTWAYFTGVAQVPGGLADWAGRFVTQFFYYAPAGAALLAVLLCSVQLLTWAACRQRTPGLYALSFLPSVLLLVFYCDENALAGAAVALLIALAATPLLLLLPQPRLRHILEIILVPLLYMACGPLMIVYVITIVCRELSEAGGMLRREPFSATGTKSQSAVKRSGRYVAQGAFFSSRSNIPERSATKRIWTIITVTIVLAVLCPLIAQYLFPYPLQRLYTGTHYYRYHNLIPGLLWAAALASAAVIALSCTRRNILPPRWGIKPGIVLYLVVAGLGTLLTFRSADASKEEWMRYDFMVRMQMWNRIMLRADAKNPDTPKTVSCLNLALGMTGRLPDSQFEYFQNGPDGLLPPFVGDHTNPVSTSEIYWHLGMVNTAQRFAFEAQEAIPDFQKSARLYRRLAETNIVNGDWDVARKYLKALHNARFYRRWADETAALLDAGTVFEKRPELALARDRRLTEHDFLFSDTEMDSMLGLLNVEHPDNDLALGYLMAWCLLRKDLDRFVECIGMVTAPAMPKAYQEALLLRWVLTHSDFNGLPPYIAPARALRISNFIADLKSGKTEAEMSEAYGDTYWFYYYYRYRNQPSR